MLNNPKEGVKNNTMDITLTEEEITTQSIKTNLDVIGRKGFCMEIVFKVTKHMVFILSAILKTRRKLFVFLLQASGCWGACAAEEQVDNLTCN